MKRLIFLLTLIVLSNSINVGYCQGWVLSTKINATEIEPRYSVIDNNNNLYVLSYFTDTIYSPYNII